VTIVDQKREAERPANRDEWGAGKTPRHRREQEGSRSLTFSNPHLGIENRPRDRSNTLVPS
jgi:hypothetical protein